ncbi:hypothetical protein C8Q80DRAFT_1123940 [Daedaleopsis nitida]|nr:hypothetical protein C8Q80DRAFT_1123940 [Daedaleopsis nitida]
MSPVADYSYLQPSNGKRGTLTIKMGPDAILSRCYVEELEELTSLRRQGWLDEQLNTRFKHLCTVCNDMNEETQQIWYKQLQSVVKELNTAGHFLPMASSFEFLNVRLIEHDLLQYALFLPCSGARCGKSKPTPFPAGFSSRFPLIMLNMHRAYWSLHDHQLCLTMPTELKHVHTAYCNHLLVVQLIVALEAV